MNKIFICFIFLIVILTSTVCVNAADNPTSLNVGNDDYFVLGTIDDVKYSVCSNSSLYNAADNSNNNIQTNELQGNIDKHEINGPDLNSEPVNFKGDIDIKGPNLSLGDLSALQSKIDTTSDGSTLYLDRDYQNNVKSNTVTINKNIIIDGKGHTVDFGYFKDCYFKSTKGDITVRNLIIKNAYNDDDDYGGAFYLNNINGRYIFDNCSFIHCWSQKSGGAIYAKTDMTLFVMNCIFEDNSICDKSESWYDKYLSVIKIKDYPWVNRDGGAIWAKNYINIDSCIFRNNYANGNGGAVYSSEGNVIVSNSIFETNMAYRNGGAIYAAKGNVETDNNRFLLNEAIEVDGGAIYAKYNIASTTCEYFLNFNDRAETNSQLKSVNGKVNIIEKEFNPTGPFDKLDEVDLNKKNVSLWIKDSRALWDFFSFMDDKNPVWENIVLTLSPNTVYEADYYNTFDFCLHLNTKLTIIGQQGSVIKGDKQENSFIYVGSTAAVNLINVTLENFQHCFENSGSVCCVNSSFYDNNALDNAVTGGVIINGGSAIFDNCNFAEIHAREFFDNLIGGYDLEDDMYGAVLFAYPNSFNILSNCHFVHCRDDFIYAGDYSTVVVRQKNNIGESFKDCYFAKTASFSVVSSELPISTRVFNCSNAGQLQKALYSINSLTPNVEGIVINLQPGIYELSADWISKNNFMRSMDWRDEYYHHSSNIAHSELFENPKDNIERYALDVGIIPIEINGNQSTIKLIKGDNKNNDHFAFIGKAGVLSVNNISFSNFNGIFHNYGFLELVDCTFDDNYNNDGGSVVSGVESIVNFINCIFKNNAAGKENTDIFNLLGGQVHFNSGCKFTNFLKTRNIIGSMSHDGVVEAVSGLKSRFIFNESASFKANVLYDKVYCLNVTSDDYLSHIDDANNDDSDLLLLAVRNVNEKGMDLTGLKSKSNIFLVGNGINLFKGNLGNNDKGGSILIQKYESRTFANVIFSNYTKLVDNQGTCHFINCTFKDNKCSDYLVNNSGSCQFTNCSFINNSGKNLIFNKEGLITIENCSFNNNSYKNEGLIYNNKGTVNIFNSSFSNCGEITVYNFETHNWHIWNTTGCTAKYEEEKPDDSFSWANLIEDIARFLLMFGASLIAGYAGYLVGSFFSGLLLANYYGVVANILAIFIGTATGAAAGIFTGFAFTGIDYLTIGMIFGHHDLVEIMWNYVKSCGYAGAIGGLSASISKIYDYKIEKYNNEQNALREQQSKEFEDLFKDKSTELERKKMGYTIDKYCREKGIRKVNVGAEEVKRFGGHNTQKEFEIYDPMPGFGKPDIVVDDYIVIKKEIVPH